MKADLQTEPAARDAQAFLERSRRHDRWAVRVITAGGVGVIAVVIGIFALIIGVALPLFRPASVSAVASGKLPGPDTVLAAGLDEYRHHLHAVRRDGTVTGHALDGAEAWREILRSDAAGVAVARVEASGPGRYSLLWADGAASLVEVSAHTQFDAAGARTIRPRVATLAAFPPAEDRPLRTRLAHDGQTTTRLDWLPTGEFRVERKTEKTDFLGNKKSQTSRASFRPELDGELADFLLDASGRHLYLGSRNGTLGHWDLGDGGKPEAVESLRLPGGRGVAALAFVLGEVSLAVADSAGGLGVWMKTWSSPDAPVRTLTPVHTLRAQPAGMAGVAASPRSKTLYSAGGDGRILADHMTSGRALWATPPTGGRLLAWAVDPRDAALLTVAADGSCQVWEIRCPHPEVSLRALFGKVWYEGSDKPAHVWQSSSGTDDYEPKFGLAPLMLGTLKGAFYSLLFAAPLAIFGALYTSQFMGPRSRAWIKPAVEVMAAVPSVVIGFLAGLWLAPLLENRLPGVFLLFLTLPLSAAAGFLLLRRLRGRRGFRALEGGLEFAAMMPCLLGGVWLAMAAGAWLEGAWLGGDFRRWLFDIAGVRADQRNAVVIAFALGFTVIPVIFTLADDALSSVPRNLTAASLALGASRWQTAWRVVMPSASPGIFAAVMIGIGRAVGETMIVLMATGNTPILDWGPFNGMRTLSANIAVEIPEAPHNGTLYRVLFLSGCLLFAFTFTLNTAAEVVRARLRRKYGRH